MDTAKVDIRKLQLLNDRINQCIDALNQVRLSVHGLSHTGQSLPGMATIGSFAQNPAVGLGYASPAASPFLAGLSHTSVPFTSPFTSQVPVWNPGAVANVPVSVGSINPYAALGALSPYGLSHTTADGIETFGRPVWADPLLAMRIAQTFPYAYVPVPPVVTIY